MPAALGQWVSPNAPRVEWRQGSVHASALGRADRENKRGPIRGEGLRFVLRICIIGWKLRFRGFLATIGRVAINFLYTLGVL